MPLAEELRSERGRQLIERYGCARCHAIPGIDRSRRPGLAMPQASQMNRDWIAGWLRNPQAVRPGTRMGSPGGTPAEIEELISILLVFLQQPEIVARIEPQWRCGHRPDPLDQGDTRELVKAGRKRFYQLGCSACHATETPQAVEATRSPSLADVGGKWSKAYLRQLLSHPVERYPNGGMPDFDLERNDLDALVAFLASFRRPPGNPQQAPSPSQADPHWLDSQPPAMAAVADPQLLERGKRLIQKRGCYACHHHPENRLMNGPTVNAAAVRRNAGCLRPTRASSMAPFFTLTADDRRAIAAFLSRRPKSPSPVASGELAERTIRERLQCFACHARDGAGGEPLSQTIANYLNRDLSANKAAINPPDLSGVGARLAAAWVRDSLSGKAVSNRPWLTVKMPRFSLNETQQNAIVRRLAFADQIPNLAAPPRLKLSKEFQRAAESLVGSRGFNCVNCHYLGNDSSQAGKTAPDFTRVVERVGREWFHRWVSNPARIIPGTPMPAFSSPVAGIAGDDLSTQMEILWWFLENADAGKKEKLLDTR
jgi:mono/diheme cytochrome c family protein